MHTCSAIPTPAPRAPGSHTFLWLNIETLLHRPDVLTLGGPVSEGGTERRTTSSSLTGDVSQVAAIPRPRVKLAPLSAKPDTVGLFAAKPIVPPAAKVTFANEVTVANVVSDDSDDVQALLQQRGVATAPRVSRLAPLRPITPHPAAIKAHSGGSEALLDDVFDRTMFDF